MLLTFGGHETQVALGSNEALERLETFQPEVALVDIGLPEINGYELARRLRGMPTLQGIRLVAVTGYGQAEDRQRALAAGFDDHLAKPVDLPALERLLAGRPVTCRDEAFYRASADERGLVRGTRDPGEGAWNRPD